MCTTPCRPTAPRAVPRRRRLLLRGVIVITAALLARAQADTNTLEAEECSACHDQETEQWTASRHAMSQDDQFMGEWKRAGEKWECLVCHASQYDRKTGEYSHGGVSCQSCHGPVTEDHPDTQQKLLPVTSETCQSCHSVTFGEWRVSSHGQKDIRCFDCHKMHRMELRNADSDAMCGACHTERLQDYSHATHHLKGVKCITCHMPEAAGEGLKIKGTGAKGHTFTVGAETCARCHREMVHSRGDIANLEGEVERLKGISPEALQEQVKAQERELASLRDSLKANRYVFSVIVVIAFGLGLAIQYGVSHRRERHDAPKERP